MKMRTCAVAGMFYPREPSHLEQLLEKFFSGTRPDVASRGIVSPHAGYIYSGEVAAHAFSTIPPGFSGTFVVTSAYALPILQRVPAVIGLNFLNAILKTP